MSGPEMTFSVHPRPASDEPRPVVDSLPAELLPDTTSESTQVEDISHHKDTFLGNLAFLVRYALGRH